MAADAGERERAQAQKLACLPESRLYGTPPEGFTYTRLEGAAAREMLDTIEWGEADTVLAPLVPEITWSTRYDRLPYMRRFLRTWEQAELDLNVMVRRIEALYQELLRTKR